LPKGSCVFFSVRCSAVNEAVWALASVKNKRKTPNDWPANDINLLMGFSFNFSN